MKVVLIILLALVGTIAMLFLCGCARWSLLYLIRYRILKKGVREERYTICRKHDVLAVLIALLTLVFVALLLVYGLPFVLAHISELPLPKPPLG